MKRFGIVTILALSSCMAPESDLAATGDTDFMPDDVPSGNCGETDNDACASTGEPENGCSETQQCGAGLVCAASFDGEIGRFDCHDACVPDMDDTRWCLDDAACCNAGSVCQGRGYCVPTDATSTGVDPDTGTGTGTSTTMDAGDTTTSETGASESGTSGTGTTGTTIEPERPIRR